MTAATLGYRGTAVPRGCVSPSARTNAILKSTQVRYYLQVCAPAGGTRNSQGYRGTPVPLATAPHGVNGLPVHDAFAAAWRTHRGGAP